MPKFEIELRGRPDDLQWLAENSSGGSWRIDRIGGLYRFGFDGLDSIEDTALALDRARNILAILKRSAKLTSRRDVEVEVQAINRELPDGRRDVVVIPAPASLGLSTSDPIVRIPGDNQPSQLVQDAQLIEAVGDDRNVAEALHLFNSRPGGWAQWYKIFEIIRDDIGARIPSEWASKSEIESIEHHAQFPETAGDDARHARPTWEPPKNQIKAAKAENIVRKVLRHWMRSKISVE